MSDPKMMKNNLPLWIIAVSLTIILISIPVQEAYAPASVFQSAITGAVGGNSAATTNLVVTFNQAVYVDTASDTGTNIDKFNVFTVTGNVVNTANIVDEAAGGVCAGGGTTNVILILDTALATDAVPTVSFTNDGDVFSCDGTAALVATNFVTQTPDDGLSPTFVSATTLSSTQITVTYSEVVDTTGVSFSDYTYGGIINTPITTAIAGSGTTTLTLSLSESIVNIDTPTVTYTQGGGALEDFDGGNEVATHTGSVTITGVIGGTGGSDKIPPSFVTTFDENEYPISIGDTKFTFAELGFNNPTTTVEIGKPIRVNLLMYDDFGPTYITQVELYTNTRGVFSGVSNSDTSIIYKKDSPRIVLDPNGFFSDVILT